MSRECLLCGFSGHESEFVAVGLGEDGTNVVLTRLDCAPPVSSPVCSGCGMTILGMELRDLRAVAAMLVGKVVH